MEEQMEVSQTIALAWKEAWSDHTFKVKIIAGSIILLSIVIGMPFFFAHIEQKHGMPINDRLLQLIPAIDVSIPTFIVIWSMIALVLVRGMQDPMLFMVFFCSFILQSLSRMLTITLLPLEAPAGLIPLKDPISSLFYGGSEVFITKDLFYSGHTSLQFLIFLCLTKKTDRIFGLIATILVGCFVLIQHVHYTIDVLFAFVFTWMVYKMGKWLAAY